MKKSAVAKEKKKAKEEAKAKKGNGRPRYFLATTFSVTTPTAGARILLANYDEATGIGVITVRAFRINAGFESIYCRVDAALAGDMPDNPDATLTQLHRVGVTEEFRNDAVPVTVPLNQPPMAPDMTIPAPRYLKVASYDNLDGLIEEDTIAIYAIPPVLRTTVSSKACIWLAFADDGIALPGYGESTAGAYRPTGLVVPTGCNHVAIAVEGGQWQHHPTDDRRSSAAGLAGDENKVALQREDIYKSGDAALKSDNISGSVALPLNVLVGLADRGWTTASTELEVGLGQSFTFGDPQPTKFHLGFHDGFQWSNNQDAEGAFGEIQVRINWSTSVTV